MKNIMVYIVDNIFCIVYKGRVSTFFCKGLNKGYVQDITIFTEDFLKALKKEKIKSKLFGDEVVVVKNVYFRESDVYLLEHLFLNMGFTKVNFLSTWDLLPNYEGVFIEINQSYMVFYLPDALYFDLHYFKDIPKILAYFFSNQKENFILFGRNKNIPKIKLPDLKFYYLENFDSYITDSLLKVKKCDA